MHAPSPALRATVGRLAGDEQAMATGNFHDASKRLKWPVVLDNGETFNRAEFGHELIKQVLSFGIGGNIVPILDIFKLL